MGRIFGTSLIAQGIPCRLDWRVGRYPMVQFFPPLDFDRRLKPAAVHRNPHRGYNLDPRFRGEDVEISEKELTRRLQSLYI